MLEETHEYTYRRKVFQRSEKNTGEVWKFVAWNHLQDFQTLSHFNAKMLKYFALETKCVISHIFFAFYKFLGKVWHGNRLTDRKFLLKDASRIKNLTYTCIAISVNSQSVSFHHGWRKLWISTLKSVKNKWFFVQFSVNILYHIDKVCILIFE